MKQVDLVWVKLTDVNITDDVQSIHCDTRDFYCCLDNEPKSDSNIKKFLRTKNIDAKYLINSEEIKDFLTNLEKISCEGIENVSWRFLSFEGIQDGTWIKYIRFYRHNKLGKFIVTSNEELLDWRELTEEKLHKEYLSAE